MTDDPDQYSEVEQARRHLLGSKAYSPPKRAIDVYLIASRLKRMILASDEAVSAMLSGDRKAAENARRHMLELSQSIEPLLDDLVYDGRFADGETAD